MAGRAVEVARMSLRAALGDRVRSAGPDRIEALAQDGGERFDHVPVQLVGDTLRVIDVTPPTRATFEGFLDGIQRSTTMAYVDGVPLLHGSAAAAIRERSIGGRMTTWRAPRIEHAVYASRTMLGDGTWARLSEALAARGQAMRDTDNDLPVPSRHPAALVRQALDALARVRNEMERVTGDAWCDAHATRALYVDGSVRASHAMLRNPWVVGVVKSHASLYLPDDALPMLTALEAGQRTSVLIAVDGNGRARFLTWYLRLRSAVGRDPFFGLIRVECGLRDGTATAIEEQADRASMWLLAERAPLARPDARWDVMPYAIRDCEVYLRAVA